MVFRHVKQKLEYLLLFILPPHFKWAVFSFFKVKILPQRVRLWVTPKRGLVCLGPLRRQGELSPTVNIN